MKPIDPVRMRELFEYLPDGTIRRRCTASNHPKGSLVGSLNNRGAA